jgi:hypothetical protein
VFVGHWLLFAGRKSGGCGVITGKPDWPLMGGPHRWLALKRRQPHTVRAEKQWRSQKRNINQTCEEHSSRRGDVVGFYRID